MKLLIDGTSTSLKLNGVSRFFFFILENLDDVFDEIIILVLDKNLRQTLKQKNKNFTVIQLPFKSKLFSHFVFIPIVAIYLAPQVFWSNNHRIPLLKKSIKKIFTVHDLTSKLFPETMKVSTLVTEKILFNSSLKKADKIITLSDTTKADLQHYFGIRSNKIEKVFPNYFLGKPSLNLPTHQTAFLFVGTIEPRKNLPLLINAYCGLCSNIKKRFPLIIAGSMGWKSKEVRDLEKLHKDENIYFLYSPSDETLINLYQSCAAVVFPSIYEGFGLPIIEALSYKKCLICSDIPSSKEIANKSAIFFKNGDGKHLASCLKAATKKSVRQSYELKAAKRAKELSISSSNIGSIFSKI